MSYTEIYKCRICENDNLLTVIDMGEHAIASQFPKQGEKILSVCL
jgi:hypothetical protein